MELSIYDANALAKYEAIIERGMAEFVAVGEALLSIRNQKLYRATHNSFEAYCADKWGMSRRRADQLIGASQTVLLLTDSSESEKNFSHFLPKVESHVTPLTVLEPAQQIEAWTEAVATAPNGKVTGAYVQAVVDDMRGNGRHKPKSNYAAEEATPDPRDQCQTPPYAVDPLLPYLPDTDCVIWEPAAGEGLLAEALFDCGYRKVTVSDAITGQNFFESEPDAWDILITNPPFSLKYKWLERCYALGKPFALLLPVETLGAASAQVLFREYGIDVIFMSPRIDFKMPNEGWNGSGAQFPSAWFCWRLLDMPQMTFVDISVAKRAFVEALR